MSNPSGETKVLSKMLDKFFLLCIIKVKVSQTLSKQVKGVCNMANISDIIENFILKALGQERELNISRNELANYFACSPSQINYVLEGDKCRKKEIYIPI